MPCSLTYQWWQETRLRTPDPQCILLPRSTRRPSITFGVLHENYTKAVHLLVGVVDEHGPQRLADTPSA